MSYHYPKIFFGISMFLITFLYLGKTSSDQTLQSFAETSPYYDVKSKDTISTILFKLGFKPIYGPNNYLEQTLKLNDRSTKADANIIYPGEILKLPIDKKFSNACMHVLDTNEVIGTYTTECNELMAKNANRSLSYIQQRYVATEELDVIKIEPIKEEIKEQPKEVKQIEAAQSLATKKIYSEFTFGVDSGFQTLNGSDNSDNTKGELLSKLSGGIFIDWMQHWSESFKTSVGISGKEVIMQNTDDSKVIKNKTNTVSQFTVSMLYQLGGRTSLGLKLGAGDYLFYRGQGGGVYQVDVLTGQSYGLILGQTLYVSGPMKLLLHGEYGQFTLNDSAPYNADTSDYYGLGIRIVHYRNPFGLSAELNYGITESTIQSVNYEFETYNFRLGMIWTWEE
jgi:hypothetical protein